jgi:hypothetical protein
VKWGAKAVCHEGRGVRGSKGQNVPLGKLDLNTDPSLLGFFLSLCLFFFSFRFFLLFSLFFHQGHTDGRGHVQKAVSHGKETEPANV